MKKREVQSSSEQDFTKEILTKMVLNEVLDMEECLEEVMEDMDPDLFPAIQTGRAEWAHDLNHVDFVMERRERERQSKGESKCRRT